MSRGNVVRDKNIVVVHVDRGKQLALYDALPQRWRRLIDDLPVPQDLREVEAVRQKFGEARGYELIIETYKAQYPGWKPAEEDER